MRLGHAQNAADSRINLIRFCICKVTVKTLKSKIKKATTFDFRVHQKFYLLQKGILSFCLPL